MAFMPENYFPNFAKPENNFSSSAKPDINWKAGVVGGGCWFTEVTEVPSVQNIHKYSMINFLYSAQLNFMPFITGYTASQEFPQFQNIQSELKVNYPTKLFFFF